MSKACYKACINTDTHSNTRKHTYGHWYKLKHTERPAEGQEGHSTAPQDADRSFPAHLEQFPHHHQQLHVHSQHHDPPACPLPCLCCGQTHCPQLQGEERIFAACRGDATQQAWRHGRGATSCANHSLLTWHLVTWHASGPDPPGVQHPIVAGGQ